MRSMEENKRFGFAPLFKDLTGQRFGRLLVQKHIGTKGRASLWLCLCDCGAFVERTKSSLSYQTEKKSCGCVKPNKKHGKSKSSEYMIWEKMKQRCAGVYSTGFKYYGARGIFVCDRWLSSFENFYEDMGPRPSKRHSIDRLDVNGPYSKENCRWASIEEQANNKRNNKYYNLGGEMLTLPQMSRKSGVPASTIKNRLARGLSVEQATIPANRKVVSIDVVREIIAAWKNKKSRKEVSRELGLSIYTCDGVRYRYLKKYRSHADNSDFKIDQDRDDALSKEGA